MPKTLGTLFQESRLIAKTINRIQVEVDNVDLSFWKYEGKLLCCPMGDCLSSSTLLVKGNHVPTYGFDGRCYGVLFDAEKCNIYDVNAGDANTNRTDKLQKREDYSGMNFLTSNPKGLTTLDDLSQQIKDKQTGVVNEVLLDAPKDACVGLFVRANNMEKASPAAIKDYYLSLYEVMLVKKLLVQSFDFPADLRICQYFEREGKLATMPSPDDLKSYAGMHGINEKKYPALFEMLSDKYTFKKNQKYETVMEYVKNADVPSELVEQVLEKVAKSFTALDGRTFNSKTIQNEPVDNTVGVACERIDQYVIESKTNSPRKQTKNKP